MRRTALLFAALLPFAAPVPAAVFTNSNASFSWTTDTLTGLHWLDFDGGAAPTTLGLAYNTVSARLGSGGDYEGWRYASGDEVKTFIFNITGIIHRSNDAAATYQGITDGVAQFTGYTDAGPWEQIWGVTADTYVGAPNAHDAILLTDFNDTVPGFEGRDGYYTNSMYIRDFEGSPTLGHWLVRQTSPVPPPAAAWLLGSALGGLGLMRRRSG